MGGARRSRATLTEGVHMPIFDPVRNGFHFGNDFETNLVADWRFGGLCGGMVYAAMDYFRAGIPVPVDTHQPAAGSALFQFIYGRQVQSVVPNLDKWGELTFNPGGLLNDSFFRWGLDRSDGGRLGELRRALGTGWPVPLGLFRWGNGGVGPHHQVLAVAVQGAGPGDRDAAVRINVYDPSYPGVTRSLLPDLAAKLWFLEGDGRDRRYGSWFVDLKYRPVSPPVLAPSVRPAGEDALGMLWMTITTGGDDLRGGNDNAEVVVGMRSGAEIHFGNINRSARWIDHLAQSVPLPLNPPVRRADLAWVDLRTHFGGGLGGDNWKVDGVRIEDESGRVLADRSGQPLVNFTGSVHSHRTTLG